MCPLGYSCSHFLDFEPNGKGPLLIIAQGSVVSIILDFAHVNLSAFQLSFWGICLMKNSRNNHVPPILAIDRVQASSLLLFTMYSQLTWFTTTRESPFTSTYVAPNVFTIVRPTNRVLYLASLSVVLNSSLIE